MVETIAKFQTVFVGTIGFVGVIVTLFANAMLARRQIRNAHDHDRRMVATALRVELQALRDTYQLRIETIDKNQDDLFIPAAPGTAVFDRLLDRIGSLPIDEGAAVIKAYALAKQVPTRIRLLGRTVGQSEADNLGWLRVTKGEEAAVRRLHSEVIENFDRALEKLAH